MHHTSHHFLIQDDDSQTNFSLSNLPVKFACGYAFHDRSQPSTRSENSQGSQKQSNSEKQIKGFLHTTDYLLNSSKKGERQIYHQSAIRKHLQQLELQYSEHRIDSAYAEAQKLKKLCQKTNHKLTSSQKQIIDKIQRQMEDVNYYQKIMRQDGWQLKKQKKNIKVSTKIQNNTIGVLVDAYLDVEIQNFLAVLTEIDLMRKWMPFMESSSLEKIVSRNCRIGHCINDFPIISKRQSFFQGIGYDRMNHNNSVFMFTRSLNNNLQLQKELEYTVHESQNAVQLDYKYLIIEYYPQSPKTGTLKMAINVDMKLSIPMFILSPATEGFGIDFYTNILKKAKDFQGSEWEKKVKQNPQFFQFVQKRIQAYFFKVNKEIKM